MAKIFTYKRWKADCRSCAHHSTHHDIDETGERGACDCDKCDCEKFAPCIVTVDMSLALYVLENSELYDPNEVRCVNIVFPKWSLHVEEKIEDVAADFREAKGGG